MSANLDLLRALAVLMVLAQHLLRRAELLSVGPIPVETIGHFGVLLFFVHTSLVLMYSMHRACDRDAKELVRSFYIRRLFRIYPLSTVAIVAALALGVTTMGPVHGLAVTARPNLVAVSSDLLMVQNVTQAPSIINVLWSLPYEIQMYLVLPFLFLWINGRRRRFWLLLVLWSISVAAAEIQPHLPALSRLVILRFMPNFLPGVIAYCIGAGLWRKNFHLSGFWWMPFILLLVGIFTQSPTFGTGWVLCLFLGLCLPFFADVSNRWLRLIAQQIAKYSYGIYLSHPFAIWVSWGLMAGSSFWLRAVILITLLITLPVVLYHAVEYPMIQVGVHWARGSPSATIAVPRATAVGN